MKIFYLARINVATEDASTRHVFEFCRHFAQLGHEVTLFVPDMGFRRNLEGVRLEYIPVGIRQSAVTYFSFYLSLLFFLAIRIQREKPDVIYTRHQPMEWLATGLRFFLRFKYVIEVNGLVPVELKINRKPDLWIAVVEFLERFNFGISDKIVVPSSLIKDHLCREYKLKESRILVVSNGANPEVSRPMEKAACRQELGLPVDEKYLVFVGSLRQWHGIDSLIRLMPELTTRIPGLHLLIVGDGPKRLDMQKWVDSNSLGQRIHLFGKVPFEEVPLYINAADICLAPYFEEGLKKTGISPLKIYEYMACARPIVCNPLGGLETLFQDHEVGVAIHSMEPMDWVEPIQELIQDPERMERLGQNGYRAVQTDFSWESICRNIATMLTELPRSR